MTEAEARHMAEKLLIELREYASPEMRTLKLAVHLIQLEMRGYERGVEDLYSRLEKYFPEPEQSP